VHVGDTIYADGPLREEVKLDDGTIWKNIVTPSKAKVAETIDEYRGNHLYNRLDEHYRRFQSQVGQVVMWDDHEVRDNWYHEQVLPAESPYTEKRVAVLAQRARQAFLEHYPVTMARGGDAQIYRSIPAGPLIEVFALDMRSYRGANNENLQPAESADTAFLGLRQVRWLADAMARCHPVIAGTVGQIEEHRRCDVNTEHPQHHQSLRASNLWQSRSIPQAPTEPPPSRKQGDE
jgi:alkaline phosphatase D